MSTFDLFVYGTLRSGEHAARLLAGCERMGDAIVRGVLYDIDGRFPALVLYGDAVVHGEIWRCPATLLSGLDQYEGTSEGMFRRVAVEAESAAGRTPCWVYAAGPALSRKLGLERRIPSGEWRGAPTSLHG